MECLLDYLPPETLFVICQNLKIVEVYSLSRTTIKYQALLNKKSFFWKEYVLFRFGGDSTEDYSHLISKQGIGLQKEPQYQYEYDRLVSQCGFHGFFVLLRSLIDRYPHFFPLGPRQVGFPLHAAARFGCIQTVEFLLGKGLILETRNSDGLTTKEVAAKSGRIDLMILICPLEVSSSEKLICQAVNHGSDQSLCRMLQLVLDSNPGVLSRVDDFFSIIAKRNLKGTVKLLLEKKQLFPVSILTDAILTKDLDLVKMFFNPKLQTVISPLLLVDTFKMGLSEPFFLACQQGSLDIIKYLDSQFPQLISRTSSTGCNAFHFACRPHGPVTPKQRISTLEFLFSRGIDIHHRTDTGVTPFQNFLNSVEFDEPTIHFFISHGASLKDAFSSVLKSRKENLTSCTSWVIKQKDLLLEVDEDGDPLYLSILREGSYCMIRELLKYVSILDVNTLGSKGYPIHYLLGNLKFLAAFSAFNDNSTREILSTITRGLDVAAAEAYQTPLNPAKPGFPMRLMGSLSSLGFTPNPRLFLDQKEYDPRKARPDTLIQLINAGVLLDQSLLISLSVTRGFKLYPAVAQVLIHKFSSVFLEISREGSIGRIRPQTVLDYFLDSTYLSAESRKIFEEWKCTLE